MATTKTTTTKKPSKPAEKPAKKAAVKKPTVKKTPEKKAPKKATAPNKLVVIETGGKQYIVSPDMEIKIERIEKPTKGNVIKFDKVLLIADDKGVQIGKPYISGAVVEAEWVEDGRNKKISILRYRSKTRERRKKGHKQHHTKVKIK